MDIQMVIKNDFGTYRSEVLSLQKEEYETLLEASKSFYNNGFEMNTDSGFIVLPPEVTKKSILIIEIIN
mgnify:FL=1